MGVLRALGWFPVRSIGISIDYSLFILSRFREELATARSEKRADAVPTAVGAAMATSGRTVLFSGTIVMISLLSLFIVRAPLVQSIAMGAVLVVACTLLTAWTMLPAFLGAMGNRVNKWQLPKRRRPAGVEARETGEAEGPAEPERPSGWARWAHTVLRHRWLAIPALALLILFLLPTFGIKLGIDLGISAISEMPSGKAEVVLANSFSPGVLSPIQILATHQGPGPLDAHDLTAIDNVTAALAAGRRVAAVSSISTMLTQTEGVVTPGALEALEALEQDPNAKAVIDQIVNVNEGSNRTIMTAISKAPVDSREASALVRDIRAKILPAYGAGPTMLVGGETAQFIDLGDETLSKLPWVMLLVLSLSFLYLMVVFRSLLVPAKAVVMNLLATGVTFGLTTWVFQGDHLSGLFGCVLCFLVADVLELKEFGFALAVAVILDATLVRLVLVPAFMKVAGGSANWWIPRWLGRVLPPVRLD